MGPTPAPDIVLPAEALDSHCHLEMIDEPVEQVLTDARSAGIRRVVTIGTDVDSSRWAADCASVHADVYAAVAIHPTEVEAAAARAADSPDQIAAATDAVLAQIEALAAAPKVRAIGETGLDYHWDRAAPKVQQEWFRAHIEIAKRVGKALVIHDRDAHEDVLRILEEQGPPEQVVFHCFSGDAAMARRCAEAGYVMSFAGNVTFANAQPLRDAAVAAPAHLLLAETDAPFLTPVPHRGKRNAPWLTAHTLRTLAEVKGMDLAELCHQVTTTAERVFGPW
ncbi:MAG TPA: TatD family hydrolase [Streptosporangiaceae bacterium]|jgi:TatD DNase family protein|nr:TatD family hydrolase [Streptosporangiaceae bacterium]